MKKAFGIILGLVVALGIGIGVGFIWCANRGGGQMLRVHKLDDQELEKSITGQKAYGWTSYSKKPYVLYFSPNGRLRMDIEDQSYKGTYTIKEGQIFSSWDQEEDVPYISKNKKSRFHQKSPFFERSISGNFGVEYWLLEGVSSTKEIFLLRHPDYHAEWGSPCFIYRGKE